jgi:hypothetical protein
MRIVGCVSLELDLVRCYDTSISSDELNPNMCLPLLAFQTPQSRALRLAAPADSSVRGGSTCSMAISQSMSTLRQPPADSANRRYLLILHLHQRACSPAAALGHWLLVGREVEGDEEKEVGGQNANSGDGGKLLACTFACIWEPLPVRASKVGP